MPEMTGLELCVALKRLEPQPHVVMMTGFDGRARLLEALRAGADEFISKPVDSRGARGPAHRGRTDGQRRAGSPAT